LEAAAGLVYKGARATKESLPMKFRLLVSALLLTFAATGAFAHDYKVGSLVINHPWSRATPNGATVAGGYLKITNNGTTPDRFVAFTSDTGKRFEIHEMSMDGGVMKMRELKDGIEIAPGATVEFKPGSYHVMFVGIEKPFAKGDKVKATLTFEKAGKIDVEFYVGDIGGTPAGEHKH
jgi:copper(I)-binding protein